MSGSIKQNTRLILLRQVCHRLTFLRQVTHEQMTQLLHMQTECSLVLMLSKHQQIFTSYSCTDRLQTSFPLKLKVLLDLECYNKTLSLLIVQGCMEFSWRYAKGGSDGGLCQ